MQIRPLWSFFVYGITMNKIIKSNTRGSLVVISGPSGSGKDSICERLREYNDNFWVSVSCTTRKPRNGEEEGINYYFIDKETFEKKIENEEFLEYALYNDDYYGTPKEKITDYLDKGIDVFLVIEVQGALKIKREVPDALFVFIMPPTIKDIIVRLKKRGTESNDKIIKRFKKAYKEINEVAKYNYVIVNDDLDEATKKLNSILISQKCMVSRIEDVYLNNPEEEIHELLIDDKVFDNNNLY